MSEWTARFIAASAPMPVAPRFRSEFELDTGHGPVLAATLTLSALGICEATINGAPVSDHLLTPGWTSYEWRLHYVEHDVARLLQQRSRLDVVVGNGWYRGRLGWIETRRYGDEIAAFAELAIQFEDGHRQVIATDENWTVGPTDILANDFYDGQTIDARLRDDPNGAAWGAVHAVDYPIERLAPDPAPPVRSVDELHPQQVWRSSSGSTLIDFGKNIVGFLRVSVSGPRGHRILFRHAEVLDGGELAIRPLRTAASTDEFVLSGSDDVFEPTFTFHGFRYAEVVGWPGALEDVATAVTAVVISSDLQRTGTFRCSVPDLNTLHDNVIRGMRGNFIDIPTDCPQRDERMGWTGDIAAFAPTAAFLFDVKEFLADWLRDLALEQTHHDGVVPFVVPDVLKNALVPQPGASAQESAAFWSDAAVWVPWALWEAYGDQRVLEASFGSMVAHARRVRSLLSPSGVWDTGFQFGDWLDPDAPAEHPERAKADPGVVATASAYRTAERVASAARVLGHRDEAKEFDRLAAQVREGFQRTYVQDRSITSDCATVYALAIAFDLLDADQRVWAGNRLAELIEEGDHRISTGFAGTPFVNDALTATGHVATAYRLLLQRRSPSWLYPVTMGATTIWERWDSMLPDGSINPGEMTSFNHYALGSVADWMHRSIAGIAPAAPGYRRIRVAPCVEAGIDWAEGELVTPQGTVVVSWCKNRDEVLLDVTVPSGATATVVWPHEADLELQPGRHQIARPLPAHLLQSAA